MATKTQDKTASNMVKVRILKAIAYDGVKIGPKVDATSGKVTPIEAVIPEAVANAHPDSRVVVLGPVDEPEAPAETKAPQEPAGKK